MSLTLTNTTLSTTFTSTECDNNFTDVANKFGSIENSDIATAASIDIDKLSAQYEKMAVQLQYPFGQSATDPETDYADGDVIWAVPIPGTSSDVNWAVTDASWVCFGVGDGDTILRVEWGEYEEDGTTWTAVSTPVSAFTLSAAGDAAGADLANDENPGGSGTLAFSTTPRSLALVMGTPGAGNSVDAAEMFFSMTIVLTRKIQSA